MHTYLLELKIEESRKFTYMYIFANKLFSQSCPIKKLTTTTVYVFYTESPTSSAQTGLLAVVILMTLIVIVTTTMAILTGALLYRKHTETVSNQDHNGEWLQHPEG